MDLTEEQLHTLRHMLGINTPYDREPWPYRNYAAANPGDEEYLVLERLGAVERISKSVPGWASDYEWFQCTDLGRAAAMASHNAIRKPKRKRVYIEYLNVRECCPDLTFKEFLTSSEFKDARDRA